MSIDVEALTAGEALRQLIESADGYEAEARQRGVWDEGQSTETVIRGIQQYRPVLARLVPAEDEGRPREAARHATRPQVANLRLYADCPPSCAGHIDAATPEPRP